MKSPAPVRQRGGVNKELKMILTLMLTAVLCNYSITPGKQTVTHL